MTTRLLGRPLEWRLRVTERLEISTARSCLRSRTLLAAPLRAVLTGLVPNGARTYATLVLPVASLPRGPVLDFSVVVDGAPGYLVPRVEIADRQAAYVAGLAAEAGLPVGAELTALLASLVGFASGAWEDALARHGHDVNAALPTYLADGLGEPVSPDRLWRWRELAVQVEGVLARLTDTGTQPTSAVDNPLLAVPGLLTSGAVVDVDEAERLLVSYRDLLVEAGTRAESAPEDEPNAADDLLLVLADYGRNWDALVYCRAPLDQPFEVELTERRSLGQYQRSPSVRARQDVVLADARTNHVSVRVTDPNVELADVRATARGGTDVSSVIPGAGRQTPEVFSFYASNPDRDYRIELDFGLRPTRASQVVTWAVAVLAVLPLAPLYTRSVLTADDLAVLVVPSTFAASLLLVREPSSLGTALRRNVTLLLVLALAAQWSRVVRLYLQGQLAG